MKTTTDLFDMTLDELIHQYLIEEYKFFKYVDADGNAINIHFLFDRHSNYLDKYLGFYKELPNLTEVIVHAVDGIFQLNNQGITYFIRHNHQEVFTDKEGNQRGIPRLVSKQVRDNVLKRINDVREAKTFDDILSIVLNCRIKGFGELAVYDTAIRIGSFLNIEPSKVYIHAGARKGVVVLESKGYLLQGSSSKAFLAQCDLPIPMQKLKAAETEHFLCSMKDEMKYLESAPDNLLINGK